MRITLVISTLWGGGAERVAAVLANAWIEEGNSVSILTFEQGQATQSYPLLAAVQVKRLGLLGNSSNLADGVRRNIGRVRVLRHAIRESNPDIVISFIDKTNVLTLLATRRLSLPIIISERMPACGGIGWGWSALRKVCYPLADVLVCQTAASVAAFQAIAKVRGVAIPNPVEIPSAIYRSQRERNGEKILIAMGRLSPEKGFDLLLESFARIAKEHPDWSLTIIGDGPLKSALQEQAAALNLAERVRFAGSLTDPFPVLCDADLFVFSSRFEGFGMALAEAMACGLAVVSFDCPVGPKEIIRDGIDGILVPAENVEALASALNKLMADPRERATLAEHAPEVLTRFSRPRVLSLWQHLFDDLLSKKQVRVQNSEANSVG